MLTKQNIIHITLDVLLVTVLFIYINNKQKSMNESVEQLREYTEEQVDNINTKIDKLIKYVTKTSSVRQPELQRNNEYISQPDYISTQNNTRHVSYPSPQQPQKHSNSSTNTSNTRPVSSQKKNVPQKPTEAPQKKQVRFVEESKTIEDDESQNILEEVSSRNEEEEKSSLEEFISNLSPNFTFPQMPSMPTLNPMPFQLRPNMAAFVSTTNISRVPQSQTTNIEVIEEEEEKSNEEYEESSSQEKKEHEEKLDDLDILEIEKAIGLKEN